MNDIYTVSKAQPFTLILTFTSDVQ